MIKRWFWNNFSKKNQKKVINPISGKDNNIINNGKIKNVQYDISGDNNTIILENHAELTNCKIYMRGNGHMLRLGSYTKFQGGELYFEDDECIIEIGANTFIVSAHIAVTEPRKKIIIGEDCMLSTGITIRTGDSHSIIDEASQQRINYAEDIHISNHVWIGADAKLLKGVIIGENSIISTGAIVTSSVPNNVIAAGIPAKIIKTGVNWQHERIYKS